MFVCYYGYARPTRLRKIYKLLLHCRFLNAFVWYAGESCGWMIIVVIRSEVIKASGVTHTHKDHGASALARKWCPSVR